MNSLIPTAPILKNNFSGIMGGFPAGSVAIDSTPSGKSASISGNSLFGNMGTPQSANNSSLISTLYTKGMTNLNLKAKNY